MRYIFIIIINLVGLSINAQTTTTNNVTPYTQGDTEWIKYSNPSERVKALQIPTETIGNISTMDLLTLCLDYPYLIKGKSGTVLNDPLLSRFILSY